MGFDNECILNIQSLPGEYFCPVCRTLVYPNEALQTPCTHLFCKPCLAYTVATTSACPYDGYLVSETEAKLLIESNKPIAEAIEKIKVHCLYHRSGCQWQGTLSECISHCTSCAYGNSPVVCNRCGAQIVHRQVQEHAQTCPGVQPQTQQVGDVQSHQGLALQSQSEVQSAVSAAQQSAPQPGTSAATAALGSTSTASLVTAAGPVTESSATALSTTAPVQGKAQPAISSQAHTAAQAPSQEQWYQQYQQYYQQFSGADPYQQQYQQYGYHQQQAQQQYPQAYGQSHPIQGQQHSQSYTQQYSQPLPQPYQQQAQPQYLQAHVQQPQTVQGQQHTQVYAQHHSLLQPQAHPQVQIHSHSLTVPVGQQSQGQAQPIRAQMQVPVQTMGQQQSQIPQPQAHSLLVQNQLRPQQQQVVGQNPAAQPQQQPLSAQYQAQAHAYPRPLLLQPQQQSQLQTQSLRPPHPVSQQPLPQSQLYHPQGQHHPLPQAQTQLHTAPAHTLASHQSFPQPHLHPQMQGAAAHQRPVQIYPPQHGPPLQHQHQHAVSIPSQMRSSQSQVPVQGQQQAPISSVQGSHLHFPPGQQQTHHTSHQPQLQLQNQVQHTANAQASQYPVTSVHQPQTLSLHSQVQHLGPHPPQPSIHTQQMVNHPVQTSLAQVPLPQSQLQSQSQILSRSVVANQSSSHQQSKLLPDGVAVQLQTSSDYPTGPMHSLKESESLEGQYPSSPSKEEKETGSSVGKDDLLHFDLVSHNPNVVSVDSDVQNADGVTDAKEDEMPEQANRESTGRVDDEKASASLINEAKTNSKADATTFSDHSPRRDLLDYNDEDSDKNSMEVEESQSKTDKIDRSLTNGHDQVLDSGKIQMPDNTSEILPTQAAAEKVQLAPQGSTIVDERHNFQGSHEEPGNIPPTKMQTNRETVAPVPHPLLHDHHERNIQRAPHGLSYMQGTMSRRSPVAEVVQPKQMFHESSLPLSNQVRPPMPFNPDPLQTAMGNNLPSGFPGSHASFGRGPPSFVPPVGSHLQSLSPALPSHDASGITRSSQVERFAGVPTGAFGTAVSMNGRVPPFHVHLDRQPVHSRQPVSYDGLLPDHIHSLASEGFPPGKQAGDQSKMTQTNGFPGRVDPSLTHASVGERFMQEERQKFIAAGGFRPSEDPHFRRIVDRRKFEEDLKQFPRPSEMDSGGGAKFGAYPASSGAPLERNLHALGPDDESRSFDRGMVGVRPEGVASGVRVNSPVSSRSMPIYKTGGHIPVSSDSSSMRPMENVDQRLFDRSDDHLERKGDAAHPELRRPGSEFGNHRLNGRHFSSPGSQFSGFSKNRFGSISLADSFGVQTSGMLPGGHIRLGDAEVLRTGDQLGSGIVPGLRGEDPIGRAMMPSHMRSSDPFGAGPGGFPNHLPRGGLGALEGFPPDVYSRDSPHFGDYRLHNFSTELHGGSFQSGHHDSLDNSRKRKEGSTGWCLICNINCETDEGRNLHYETLEHQKRVMDVVSVIKQNNAKKLKSSSEEHEESIKSRKTGFEGRPVRR